jgi:hypothetical protein
MDDCLVSAVLPSMTRHGMSIVKPDIVNSQRKYANGIVFVG